MPSNDIFSTYGAAKQAEIKQKLAELFRGNERGYGIGEVKGAKFNEDKNKWIPGGVRWAWGKASEVEWQNHLTGIRFLGLGPILDDNTVWFACIDVDKTEDGIEYDFNYAEEMGKIKRSGFPLVVYRTKSSGLRVTIFFSEPIEADYVIRRMKQIAAQLGYAGSEIFPKQAKLDAAHGDCPSWIYLPYGPTEDMFPEQCCMNESGHAMDLYESVVYAMKMRITKQQFYGLFVAEINARSNGKANGKKHPRGIWIKPEEGESYEQTVGTMLTDGPICLWHIAHQKCRNDQHYFLLNCAIFLKRKYPDNWDKALEWINFNTLVPVGDADKLEAMKKDLKNRGERPYEYTCKNPPICNHCNPKACRRQPFGVGQGNGVDHHELAITQYNCVPTTYFVNIGDERIQCAPNDLASIKNYQVKCLEHGIPAPEISPKEWLRIVNSSILEATIVDPPELYRAHLDDLLFLQDFFNSRITPLVRSLGDVYLNGGGHKDDAVRIKLKERSIYIKWNKFARYCHTQSLRDSRIESLKKFITDKGSYHDKETGRDWFRCTHSLSFDLFDEMIVKHWLSGGEWEEKDDE